MSSKGVKQTPEHIARRVASRLQSHPNYMPVDSVVWNRGLTKDTDARISGYASRLIKGRKYDSLGYVLVHVPSDAGADRQGYVREHKYVMEQSLGRPLYQHEVVHHLNHQKDDNRIENLSLMTVRDHSSMHSKEADHSRPRFGKSFECRSCGATFYRNQSQVTNGAGKYCSVKCMKGQARNFWNKKVPAAL